MNNPRRICTSVCTTQNTWLKYFYGIGLIGSFYIIILVIHQGELIQNLNKHLDKLKLEVDDNSDSETRLYKLETTINNIKTEQEYLLKQIKNLITTKLEQYSADKTGKTDYALESSGGKIISLTPDTINFDPSKTLFGISLCEGLHGPRAILQPEMYPGHCWAFKGSRGGVIIKLIGTVKIESVSVEHISESVSPTGEITSAPKKFVVSGLRNPVEKGHELGYFNYDIYGLQVQTFQIDDNNNYYEYVEFKVVSNHDNPDFTCVYRFRVHGILDKM